MKISSKTTYGFRFLLALAVSDGNEFVKLGDVAKAEDISEKYLENIVAKIKPYGFIEVKRGAQGGYRLSRPAGNIRLADVFEILEGDMVGYDRSSSQEETSNNKTTVADLWEELKTSTTSFLSSKTLEDLSESFKAKNSSQMYFI